MQPPLQLKLQRHCQRGCSLTRRSCCEGSSCSSEGAPPAEAHGAQDGSELAMGFRPGWMQAAEAHGAGDVEQMREMDWIARHECLPPLTRSLY